MRFSIVSAFAFVAAAMAQDSGCNANCFSESLSGTTNYQVGSTVPIAWTNLQGRTVTIRLAYGARNDLTVVSTLADHITNSGSFSWNIDSSLPQRVDYALEIVNDDSPDQINYSTQFDILNANDISSNPAPSSTATVTGSSSSAAAATTTGSNSASATVTVSNSTTLTTSSSSNTQTSGASSSRAPTATLPGVTVPTGNAGTRPAIGAAGGLFAVAAAFAFAL